VDVCVVGGGMAGLTAALAAARGGARVLLLHDRPVLGGNASSEVRVHICGADRHNAIPNLRETGILEELRLENLRRNPQRSFSVWDMVLYDAARREPNLEVLLNCSCLNAEMDGPRIGGVTGWQLTTQTYHAVKAQIFIDCSGDAILAPLTGAPFRMGREARSEYGESIAPELADKRTMGMTCLFQSREHASPQPFAPPSWACRFERAEELPYGAKALHWWQMGYWWIELGGEDDGIYDTERLRDELLSITLGVWDFIKNRANVGADNWALEWIQFLPGKRESRRYIGDHVLTQRDIESEGRFDDVVAYGGWSMDDHHPAGFRAVKLGHPATIFHPAPSPYGIPYRCLYSRDIENLMFAGRCASCTHAAMSSTRVMGTACSMGQAAGAAAAMAVLRSVDPREMARAMHDLQQALLRDDCYVPGIRQECSDLTRAARLTASQGDPEPVRDGVNRPVKDTIHAWAHRPGDWIAYRFNHKVAVREITLVLDSALAKNIQMSFHQKDDQLTQPPPEMVRRFRMEVLEKGEWNTLTRADDNYQRLVRIPIRREVKGVRYVPESTWGASETRLYAFYVD
jgi:hypothetical protein